MKLSWTPSFQANMVSGRNAVKAKEKCKHPSWYVSQGERWEEKGAIASTFISLLYHIEAYILQLSLAWFWSWSCRDLHILGTLVAQVVDYHSSLTMMVSVSARSTLMILLFLIRSMTFHRHPPFSRRDKTKIESISIDSLSGRLASFSFWRF